MFLSLKVEVVAGKTVPVLTQGQESLWWRVQRGAPHVPLPSPSSAGPPLVVLEVVVEPAQPEAVVEGIEVTVLPFLIPALKTQIIFISSSVLLPLVISSETLY